MFLFNCYHMENLNSNSIIKPIESEENCNKCDSIIGLYSDKLQVNISKNLENINLNFNDLDTHILNLNLNFNKLEIDLKKCEYQLGLYADYLNMCTTQNSDNINILGVNLENVNDRLFNLYKDFCILKYKLEDQVSKLELYVDHSDTNVIKNKEKINSLDSNLENIDDRLFNLYNDFNILKIDLENRVSQLELYTDYLNTRVTQNEEDIANLDTNLENVDHELRQQLQAIKDQINQLYLEIKEVKRLTTVYKYWQQYSLDNNDSKYSPVIAGNFDDIIQKVQLNKPLMSNFGSQFSFKPISDFSEQQKFISFCNSHNIYNVTDRRQLNLSYISFQYLEKLEDKFKLIYTLCHSVEYHFVEFNTDGTCTIYKSSYLNKVNNEKLFLVNNNISYQEFDLYILTEFGILNPNLEKVKLQVKDNKLFINDIPISGNINVCSSDRYLTNIIEVNSLDEILFLDFNYFTKFETDVTPIASIPNDFKINAVKATINGDFRIGNTLFLGTVDYTDENNPVIKHTMLHELDFQFVNLQLLFSNEVNVRQYTQGDINPQFFFNSLESKMLNYSLPSTTEEVYNFIIQDWLFGINQLMIYISQGDLSNYRENLVLSYEDSPVMSQVLRSLALLEKLIGTVPTVEEKSNKGISKPIFIPTNLRIETASDHYYNEEFINAPAPGRRERNFEHQVYEDNEILVVVVGTLGYEDTDKTYLTLYSWTNTNPPASYQFPYLVKSLMSLDNIYVCYKNAAGPVTNAEGKFEFSLKIGNKSLKKQGTTVTGSTLIYGGRSYYALQLVVDTKLDYTFDYTGPINIYTRKYENPYEVPAKNTPFFGLLLRGGGTHGDPYVISYQPDLPNLKQCVISNYFSGGGEKLFNGTLSSSESLDGSTTTMNSVGYPPEKFFSHGAFIQVSWDVKGSFLFYPEESTLINNWYDSSTSSLEYSILSLQNQIDSLVSDIITIDGRIEWIINVMASYFNSMQTYQKPSFWSRFKSFMFSMVLDYAMGFVNGYLTSAFFEMSFFVMGSTKTKSDISTYTFSDTSKKNNVNRDIRSGHINIDKNANQHLMNYTMLEATGDKAKLDRITKDNTLTYQNSYAKQTLDPRTQENFRELWSTSGTGSPNYKPGPTSIQDDYIHNRIDAIYRPLNSLPKPVGDVAHDYFTNSNREKLANNLNYSNCRSPSHAYISSQQVYFDPVTKKPHVDRTIVGIGEANIQGRPTGDKGAGVGGVQFGYTVEHMDSTGTFVLKEKKYTDFGYTTNDVDNIYKTTFGNNSKVPTDKDLAWTQIHSHMNNKYSSGDSFATMNPSSNLVGNSIHSLIRNPPAWDYNLFNQNCQHFVNDVFEVLNDRPPKIFNNQTYNDMLYYKIKGLQDALNSSDARSINFRDIISKRRKDFLKTLFK